MHSFFSFFIIKEASEASGGSATARTLAKERKYIEHLAASS